MRTPLQSLLAAARAACLLLPALGCGGPKAPAQEDRLTLLEAMIGIDQAFQALEPNFRNPYALEESARNAQQILDWSTDPLFDEFAAGERFFAADAAPYFAWREELEAGARQAVEAAGAADLDGLRDGFIRMKASCIGCHKRFSPSY